MKKNNNRITDTAIDMGDTGEACKMYNEDDKEGLRAFLRQPSAEAGKTNGELVGLQRDDLRDWETSDTWVEKVKGLVWNFESPSRLIEINWSMSAGGNLAGTLNAGLWRDLTRLDCSGNQLTALDVSALKTLAYLLVGNNRLTALDVRNNGELDYLSCPNNRLTGLDVSRNTELYYLDCSNNQLASVDGTRNTRIESLNCDNNPLTAMDEDAKKALFALDFEGMCFQMFFENKSYEQVMNKLYNEDDKEGLRMFLRQPSAEAGKTNGEQLRLHASDMNNWENDEAWIEIISSLPSNDNPSKRMVIRPELVWNSESPKRLTEIMWSRKNLAGCLDAGKWSMLKSLHCADNGISTLDVRSNTSLDDLDCSNNRLTALNTDANTALFRLDCSGNQLSALDTRANKQLMTIIGSYNQLTSLEVSKDKTPVFFINCNANRLQLSDLYSVMEKFDEKEKDRELGSILGEQYLPLQKIRINSELDFSGENVIDGVSTQFTVTLSQNDTPAPASDYSITDGKIKFFRAGIYYLTMTNEAIISDRQYPAKAIAKIEVAENG